MHEQFIAIEFDGKVYKIWPNSKNKGIANYFRCFRGKLGVLYLHREVWKKINGEISEGFDIHHKDENTKNNDIDNLELISKKDHHHKHKEQSSIQGLSNSSLVNGLDV